MLKKRVRVPRAHAPSAANAPPRPSDQRATIVLRVPQRVGDPPMAIVQPVQHAPTVSAPPPVSVPRARSMTVPHRGIVPLAVSALSANVPHMETVRHGVKDLTASAHRAPVVLTQTVLAQTASVLTGPALIAHPPTAQADTSVPLVSALVVRRVRSMIAPANQSVLRAPVSPPLFTMRLPLFRSLLIQQKAWSLVTWALAHASWMPFASLEPQRRLPCRLQLSPWH